MTILSTDGIGHAFGADDLFANVNVTMASRDRVGLVGPNGIGKTTLLQILAGLREATMGELFHARNLTLGYLRQEAVLTFAGRDHTIFAEMLTVFADLRRMETELAEMEAAMAAGDLSTDLFDRYGALQAQFEHGGGYDYQVEIKRVLQGLGFPQEMWETPLSHLSGGQKTRILLGRLLLEKPELLILDEPTNHLDTAALEWLENTLRRWDGALLIVSHDRYFLDRVINQVWEMQETGISSYRGNYSSYVTQRQAVWEREKSLFDSEKSRLEREIRFIRKHIAGGKTDIAKGKLRRLARDIVQLEKVMAEGLSLQAMQNRRWLEVGERVRGFSVNEAARRLRAIPVPGNRPTQLNIHLAAEHRSGRIVLRSNRLQIGYAETPLFITPEIKLERYDCVALIGPNGCGKSTLLKTLYGELEPLQGRFHLGHNIHLGYFAQAHDQLNLQNSVLAELMAHTDMEEADARHYLARYLFRGDDVFKLVSELSGGERGRLALAILADGSANFLLLDEPTNHLDIPSQEVLQNVLEGFNGTIVLVSHDRYLIDRLATQIWEVRDEQLHIFAGSYSDFLSVRAAEAELAARLPQTAVSDLDWLLEMPMPPQLSPREQRRRDRRLDQLESELDELEDSLAELQLELGLARTDGNEARIARLEPLVDSLQQKLDNLNDEWDRLTTF